jgi:AcrR family transcriptional regulator
MTASEAPELARRPKRADARRNYDLLIGAARKLFAAEGTGASMEEIARAAGVGIGTMYRNFPNRQALIEAVYLEELSALCESANELHGLEPWEALATWLRRYVGYAATKKALATELLETLGKESEFFRSCHGAIRAAAGPLLTDAQNAGVVRTDIELIEAMKLVGGVATSTAGDTAMAEKLVEIVLDGLRTRPV